MLRIPLAKLSAQAAHLGQLNNWGSVPGLPTRFSPLKIFFKKVSKKVRTVPTQVEVHRIHYLELDMNDDFHLNDDTPTYLWTVDTLDQGTALAMTPEAFEAEMRRLSDRARRQSRKPAHRRALKAGAVRLVRRLRGTEEAAHREGRASKLSYHNQLSTHEHKAYAA